LLKLADGKFAKAITYAVIVATRIGPHINLVPYLETRLAAKTPVILGFP
jgi:hypothetical protein